MVQQAMQKRFQQQKQHTGISDASQSLLAQLVAKSATTDHTTTVPTGGPTHNDTVMEVDVSYEKQVSVKN